MAKLPHLGSGLITRKGDAAPAVKPDVVENVPVVAVQPRGTAGTIAVTVRLDPERYERLKMHGVRQRRSNQEILVEALDAFLAARGVPAAEAAPPAGAKA